MKFGFRSEATVEDLQIAQRLGISVIELHWHDRNRAQADVLLARLQEYGVGVSALLTGDEHLTTADLQRDLDATKRFGGRAFVTHPHPLVGADAAARQAFQDTFAPAAAYAKEIGLTLAVHSCGLHPHDWDLMFDLVPALGLKYDPSFSLEAGRNYLAEVAKYGPRIVHVHIKDERYMGRETDFSRGIMQYEYTPAGTGDINWGGLIALLYEAGYEGDLALETHSRFWWDHLELDLKISQRHIEQFLP
jgi:sugar phosphate isomerase/epimerase